MTSAVERDRPTPLADAPAATRWEGRVFGSIVLAAFVLYGVGSSSADDDVGMILVVLNSIAVSIAGVIGFRLLRRSDPTVAVGYLLTRTVEGVLLAGGIALAVSGSVADADTTGYLLGMAVLGAGSIPFCRALGRHRWLPKILATWGVVGYASLLVGALLELATGRSIALVLAAPGGLFELVLGIYLLRHGFHRQARS